MIENLDPDIYYDVSISAIYPGGIQSSPSTGKTATNGEQCTCRSYLIRQRTLERTIIRLEKTITGLADKIDGLASLSRSYTVNKKKSGETVGKGKLVEENREKRQSYKFTANQENPFRKWYQ